MGWPPLYLLKNDCHEMIIPPFPRQSAPREPAQPNRIAQFAVSGTNFFLFFRDFSRVLGTISLYFFVGLRGFGWFGRVGRVSWVCRLLMFSFSGRPDTRSTF